MDAGLQTRCIRFNEGSTHWGVGTPQCDALSSHSSRAGRPARYTSTPLLMPELLPSASGSTLCIRILRSVSLLPSSGHRGFSRRPSRRFWQNLGKSIGREPEVLSSSSGWTGCRGSRGCGRKQRTGRKMWQPPTKT